ncbi:ABC transporter permease [Actinoplanes sp. TFC3]|uniref:ABC transporter permease n=1 Tax=Actinoplanes sp. TFC3 TaxID=1710355 RepID=UPI000831C620|nr:ABC transporter permease [Actinoplanes sp. TFC3]
MTGTGSLIRLILRRDRFLLPLWAVLLPLVPVGYASSLRALFPTAAERAGYARVSADSAGFVALLGPLHGSSLGDLVAWRSGFLLVLAGLFSLLTVIRHTRTDEELGRTELIGAGAVSRPAGLVAALLVALGANVVLAVIVMGGLIGLGLPVAGSVLFGVSFGLAGWAFAAVGAVSAQLSSSARTARSIAIIGLGATFVLRMAGDVDALGGGALSWLTWVSPVGWIQHVFPYGPSALLPLFLALAFTVAAGLAAVAMVSRRDIGEGVLPARPGTPTAGAALSGPIGLAWRLHRGMLIGWLAGFAVLGLVFGGVAKSIADLADENSSLSEILGRLGGSTAAVDQYFATALGMMGLIAAAYAVQAALRLHDEEGTGHAEAVLATRTGRVRWAAGHLMFSLFGPAAALLVGGAVCGLVAGLALDNVGREVPALLGGAAAQIPAVWVLATLAVLLFGVLPRQAPAAWGALAVCFFLLIGGAILQLNHWIMDLSPFTHIPHLPGAAATPLPFVVLTALAVVLAAAGLTAFRRRDVPAI